MKCRKCGACCIAPSFSCLPKIKKGKKAGERCPYLNIKNLCSLFGRNERPSFCIKFQPDPVFCGENFKDGLEKMQLLESDTHP